MIKSNVMYFNEIPYVDISNIEADYKSLLDVKIINEGELLDYVQGEFTKLFKKNTDMSNFASIFNNSDHQAVVFGGWVRDRVFEFFFNRKVSLRDIDFVFNGDIESKSTLNKKFTKNDFGGIELKSSLLSIDAWSLAETFLIKKNKLPIAFETLPLTADFLHNAIAFFPIEFFGFSQIVEAGSIDAIKNLYLDFKALEIPFPEMQVVRILAQCNKMNLNRSKRVDTFLMEACSDLVGLNYYEKYLSKYCTFEERNVIESQLSKFWGEDLLSV